MHCGNQYKNLRREVSLFGIVHKIRNRSLLLICQCTDIRPASKKKKPLARLPRFFRSARRKRNRVLSNDDADGDETAKKQ